MSDAITEHRKRFADWQSVVEARENAILQAVAAHYKDDENISKAMIQLQLAENAMRISRDKQKLLRTEQNELFHQRKLAKQAVDSAAKKYLPKEIREVPESPKLDRALLRNMPRRVN